MKHEITILETTMGYENERFQEMQKEGWELAGNIEINKYDNTHPAQIYIPLKRTKGILQD